MVVAIRCEDMYGDLATGVCSGGAAMRVWVVDL